MFYVYTALVPFLILVANYLATLKCKHKTQYTDVLLRTLLWTFGYTFFLYYLDAESLLDAGWAFITLITFLIPISVIIILLKLFYVFRRKSAK
jgi:hypothetical protein